MSKPIYSEEDEREANAIAGVITGLIIFFAIIKPLINYYIL